MVVQLGGVLHRPALLHAFGLQLISPMGEGGGLAWPRISCVDAGDEKGRVEKKGGLRRRRRWVTQVTGERCRDSCGGGRGAAPSQFSGVTDDE